MTRSSRRIPRPRTRELVGRRIVDVYWSPFTTSTGDRGEEPTLVLDNGRQLRFAVSELEGEYAVTCHLTRGPT